MTRCYDGRGGALRKEPSITLTQAKHRQHAHLGPKRVPPNKTTKLSSQVIRLDHGESEMVQISSSEASWLSKMIADESRHVPMAGVCPQEVSETKIKDPLKLRLKAGRHGESKRRKV